MTEHGRVLLLLVLALSAAGCTNMEAQIKESGTLGPTDTAYVDTAYHLAQLDNQAGELAKTRAADPRVLATATQTMSQADTLSPGLQAAVKAEGVTPPQGLPQDMSTEVGELRGLHGAAFDHQYVADELGMHERAVNVFQKENDTTKDGALRTQVQAELPVVKDNLNKFKTLSSDYGQSHAQ